MLKTTFSSWPDYTQQEADAVSKVLLSNKVNYWTGSECHDFESEFAAWAGTEYAVALASGTVALELALKVLELQEGDEVVVTSRTFIASVSAIVTAGAVPVFADVDADSQNITAESIAAVLSKRTKAIICVHLAGWPCDMGPIMALADEHDLYVIEDCAQAHGAKYKDRSVGSIGHIGCWSFCQDKIMTTGGEGGMVTTNDKMLWSKMWSYKDHGKSWQAVFEKQHAPGFRWLHDSLGSNYRMTEMQAAIGRIQLSRLQGWTEKRQTNAAKIWDCFRRFDSIRVPQLPAFIDHAAYKCYVFVRPEKLNNGWDRDRIVNEIVALGVPCFSGSCSEVYLEKAFDNTAWRPKERLPVARALGETSLMFLVHPSLSEDEISRTTEVISQVMIRASR
ncbi:MAG: DegT/DnrJ/EryC1/StrS aminotransferase family protein [Gammaproteobacteria bacterium]|nr:DegT/DnrJ/EryC1/StrS aminotransferase family protein [Gammaproteobacteria bacterium]